MTRQSNALDRPLSPELLAKFNESSPYYTSYPALSYWSDHYTHNDYVASLKKFFQEEGPSAPLQLYVHIPFCAKLCWYCICNMSVTNDEAKIQEFLNYLYREIDMLKKFFDDNSIVPNFREVHFGGGTPSHLSDQQFTQLTEKLSTLVDLKQLDEFAMEIDPRTTNQESMRLFASKGVQRISFGVQDFNPDVQKAINRIQPFEMVDSLLSPEIRRLFKGFNFDLIYGLPLQSRQTVRETVELVKKLAPSRISFFKFAYVPEVRKHMKLIKESELMPIQDLPQMFIESVQTLLDAGYLWVGIDHFAKPDDDLGMAVQNKTVWRTFNGFTPGRTNHLIGLGPSSTGSFGSQYSQSVYENHEYFKAISENRFPVFRGYQMTPDEIIRRDVIFSLLCRQEVDFSVINRKHSIGHEEYFASELAAIRGDFIAKGLAHEQGSKLTISEEGRLFLRNICKSFDVFMRDKTAYPHIGPSVFRKQKSTPKAGSA